MSACTVCDLLFGAIAVLGTIAALFVLYALIEPFIPRSRHQ